MEEKYVSINELINFIEKNYKRNVWNNGITQLYAMYLENNARKFAFTDIEIKKHSVCDKTNLEIMLKYPDDLLLRKYGDRFTIREENGICYIIDSTFSLNEQDKILYEIDFTKLYEYYEKNEFTGEKYYLNGVYNKDGVEEKIPITISNTYINIGDSDYHISYFMKLDKICKSEEKSAFPFGGLEFAYKLKAMYTTDPDFLNNLKVKFLDLPPYIQELLYSNDFDDMDTSKEKKSKSYVKGIYEKMKQFVQ